MPKGGEDKELLRLKKTDPNTWNVSDVAQWLQVINMEQYQRTFIENSISGDVLFDLNVKELKSIGIDRLGHRKKLLYKIKALSKATESAWSARYDESVSTDDDSQSDASSTDRRSGRDSMASRGSSSSRITVKCSHKGETSALKVDRDISYRELLRKLKKEFGQNIKLSYRDEDGDLISLRKQAHLEDALEDLSGPLRLKVATTKKKKKASKAKERGGEAEFSSAEADIIENLLDPTCVIDEAGKVLFFNRAAEDLWGFSKRQIHGRNIKMIMPKDVAESHDFYLWKFSRGEGSGSVIGEGRKVIGRSRNGNTIPVHLAVTHSKKNHTFTGVFKDIRTKDTGDGKSFGGLSSEMLDNLLQCVIVIDKSASVLFFNKSAEKLLGYSASEVLGRNVNMLMPAPYKEEHDGYVAKYLKTGRAKAIGKGREVAARCKDGTVLPVKLSITEYGTADTEINFTGILEPVGELVSETTGKSRLENERELLDGLVVPAVLIDEGGRIQVFNAAAQKLWGYSLENVIGKNVRMLMGSPDREKHDRYIKRYLRTGESKVIGVGRDVLLLNKEGTMIPARLSVTEKANEAGKKLWTAIVQPM